MTTQYQYNFIYFPTPIKMDPLEFEALSEHEKALSFGNQFAEIGTDLTTGIAKLPEGDWEAVSHDLTVIANTIMFTFMIRRPKN